jgi:hypothetical protein
MPPMWSKADELRLSVVMGLRPPSVAAEAYRRRAAQGGGDDRGALGEFKLKDCEGAAARGACAYITAALRRAVSTEWNSDVGGAQSVGPLRHHEEWAGSQHS